jgi:hypothetical protein
MKRNRCTPQAIFFFFLRRKATIQVFDNDRRNRTYVAKLTHPSFSSIKMVAKGKEEWVGGVIDA